jgi:hypothetical protein
MASCSCCHLAGDMLQQQPVTIVGILSLVVMLVGWVRLLTRPTLTLDCFNSTARACQVGSSCWHCNSRTPCVSILLEACGSMQRLL